MGAYCVIEDGAKVGAGSVLYPHVYVGPGATLGEECVFFPGVAIYEWARIGNRVRIHANSTIGADGFGYASDEAGNRADIRKIYHLGGRHRRRCRDRGEYCVDRGTWGDTRISRMAKLDNQVQVAHNAHVDEGAILCGCVGLSGGAKVGNTLMSAAWRVWQQLVVGDGARVGGMTLVSKDVAPGARWWATRSASTGVLRIHAMLADAAERRPRAIRNRRQISEGRKRMIERSRARYSILMFASRISFPHRARSVAMKRPNCSGVLHTVSMPSSPILSFTS